MAINEITINGLPVVSCRASKIRVDGGLGAAS